MNQHKAKPAEELKPVFLLIIDAVLGESVDRESHNILHVIKGKLLP